MAVDPQIRALARRVASLEKARLAHKQPRLAHSSIEGGALQATDDYGDLTMILGTQFDGTTAPVVVVSPAPPKPSLPFITAQQGALRVYWDGTWADGAVAPMDFARVTVYARPLASYVEPEPLNQAIIVGTFVQATGGEVTAALDPGIEYAVYFHAWNVAGKYGPSSDVATGTPGMEVLPEELASKATVYHQDTAPWPDGDTGHADDVSDLWINTSLGPGNLYRIVSRTIASNVATVTTETEHDVTVGKLIQIDSVDDTFNGAWTVTAVDATTISFALVAADLPATPTTLGKVQGQDIRPLNRYFIWDASNTWVAVQDSDTQAAASLNRDVKDVQGSVATLAVTATDAYNTAYAADGRVSISDYEPGPDDVTGKNEGSLWITRTRDRVNLCANPSFEDGSTTNWSVSGGTPSVVTVDPAGDGTKAMKIVNTAATEFHAAGCTVNFPITEGQEFIASGYLKSVSGATDDFGAAVNFYGASGYITTIWGNGVDLTTDAWSRAFVSGVAPAGATYANALFFSQDSAASAEWLLDAVLVERTLRLGRYFDGGSEGGSWSGAPELSESTLDGNAIIRLFTLEDAAWTEKFWTADTIASVSASTIDRGEMSGAFLADNTVPVDKAYMPMLQAAETLAAGDLVHVANVGGLAMVYKADGNAGRRCNGFVLTAASTGQNVTVYTSGYNPLCSGLTPGVQFLSSTAGQPTNAAPIIAGTIAQRVGYAVNATTLVFDLGIAVSLA